VELEQASDGFAVQYHLSGARRMFVRARPGGTKLKRGLETLSKPLQFEEALGSAFAPVNRHCQMV
jgi:hypothetical protein